MSTVSRGSSAVIQRQLINLSKNLSSQIDTIEDNIKHDLDPSIHAENGALKIKNTL